MRRFAAVVLLAICLGGCQAPEEESHMHAIVGTVLIDGGGGPPLSDAVVVTSGDRIREAGPRSTVAIPEEASKVDGAGRFVVPAPLDVCPSAKAPSVNGRKIIDQEDRAAIEAARDAGAPFFGRISTQSGVRAMVDAGAVGFLGMITDTEDPDPALVARLRDLRIFFAPALGSQGTAVEIAKRNTRRLFASGVPIAVASNGGDPLRETELLVDAGIPPLDVIVAATRNSAAALGELQDAGTVEAGKRADLLVLSANPGEDIRNLRKVVLRMSAGNWMK